MEVNTAKEIIKKYIYEKLQNSELKIGSRLPTEIELAKILGVGRSSVREALQELKGSGLVTSIQGSGYRISSTPENTFSEAISTLLILKPILPSEISQLREAIEIKIIELIMEADILDQDIELLNTYIKEMENNSEKATELDIIFHQKLAEMSNNTLIRVFIQALSKISNSFILISWNNISEKERENLIKVHKEIVQFLIEKNVSKTKNKVKQHYKIADKIIYKKYNTNRIRKAEQSIQEQLQVLFEKGYTKHELYNIFINSTNSLKTNSHITK